MIPHSKPWISEEDIASVEACLKSNMIACGKKVEEFEANLAAYTGDRFAKTFSSGTSALLAALIALEIKSGDEVVLPTYVCHEVMDAVLAAGASPVLCDIGEFWNATPGSVATCITKRTKAIIVVHSLGIKANGKAFLEFGIPVIEDRSQCLDAAAERHGCMSVYSFNSTKCLAAGEGGAVTTSDEELAQRLKKFSEASGSRISDLQASLALSQLSRYSEMLATRKTIAQYYFKHIDNTLTNKFSQVKEQSMFYRFLLHSTKDFDSIRKKMDQAGISVRKGVDSLLHHKYPSASADKYPNATQTFQTTVSIPIYPSLTTSEQIKVSEAINSILQ